MQSSKKVILAVQNNSRMDARDLAERTTGVEVKKNRAERRQEKRRKDRK
ncbi:hypothetical protein [Paenibacillus xylanexedens]|nr:hypothetical protein [Paenibacillus xylanexedens]